MSSEIVAPVGDRVVVLKDEEATKTSGGIILPDQAKMQNLTGLIVGISPKVEHDFDYANITKYCRVLFNPMNCIPASFELNNRLYVVPIKDVIAVINGTANPKDSGFSEEGALIK